MSATCRYCSAPIKWVKLPSGKSMPLDTKHEVLLVENSTGTYSVQNCYHSHFETCPNADEARSRARR